MGNCLINYLGSSKYLGQIDQDGLFSYKYMSMYAFLCRYILCVEYKVAIPFPFKSRSHIPSDQGSLPTNPRSINISGSAVVFICISCQHGESAKTAQQLRYSRSHTVKSNSGLQASTPRHTPPAISYSYRHASQHSA